MKTYDVYNLVFPDYRDEMEIFGYRFMRVEKYAKRVSNLYHPNSLSTPSGEFYFERNLGSHQHTAIVEVPENQENAVLEWSGPGYPAIDDLQLLLMLFTRRDVFLREPDDIDWAPDWDSRNYLWGEYLIGLIPSDNNRSENKKNTKTNFEIYLNKIYQEIRTNDWLQKYNRGHFLSVLRSAFLIQKTEPTFFLCWIIWEHLYSQHKKQRVFKKIVKSDSSHNKKISNLLIHYGFCSDIENKYKKISKNLDIVRNEVIHDSYISKDNKKVADIFIYLTEMLVAKILRLKVENEQWWIVDQLDEIEKHKSTNKPPR